MTENYQPSFRSIGALPSMGISTQRPFTEEFRYLTGGIRTRTREQFAPLTHLSFDEAVRTKSCIQPRQVSLLSLGNTILPPTPYPCQGSLFAKISPLSPQGERFTGF